MIDRYNDKNMFDRFIDWSDTNNARSVSWKLQRALGVTAFLTGAVSITEGLWNHDLEHVAAGIGAVSTGGFVAKYADFQLQQLPDDVHNV